MKHDYPNQNTSTNFYFQIVLILILISTLGIGQSNAQNITVAGSVGVDGTYPSLTKAAGAFLAINGTPQTGANITITVTADVLTEDGANSLNAGAWTSLTIVPSGGVRTISGPIAAPGFLINLNGADNVNINGTIGGVNSLILDNTSTGSQGTIRFIADATNNIIQNCTIKGSGNVATVGTVFFSTGTSTGNDNNTITGCTITSSAAGTPANAILSIGSVAPGDNSGIIISNNKIQDYFHAAAVFSCGVLLGAGTTDVTVTGNSFFQTATRTYTTVVSTFSHSCITVNTNAGNNFTITNNFLGGTAPNCGGTAYTIAGNLATRVRAINITAGIITATNLQGNTIANFNLTSSSGAATLPGTWCGIYVTSGLVNIGTTTGNTIGSGTGNGSITLTGTTTGATAIGIGSVSSNTITISNNIVGSITALGSTTNISAGIIGIGSGAGGGNFNVSNNTIGSTTTSNSLLCSTASVNAGAQQLKGIEAAGNAFANISNNTIANCTNNYVGSGTTSPTCGVTSTGPSVITGNTIYSVTTTSTVAGTGTQSALYGIGLSGSFTNPGITISDNKIYNLISNNATAVNTQAIGIFLSCASTAGGLSFINRNFVHSITNASTGATALVCGIQGSGYITYANNMIRLGIDGGTSFTNGINIRGIHDLATTTGIVSSCYFNSVYIGGSGVGGVSTIVSACYLNASATPVHDIKDNIFYNARSNGAGTGKHYAISIAGATVNPPGQTVNYNDYLATGTGGFIGFYNGADQALLSNWQSATGQDGNSLNSDPQFIAPTGGAFTTIDLHINPSVATAVESSGLAIGGFNDDIDNAAARSALSPTDIGADAGIFTLLDISGPSITYTILPDECSLLNRTLTATINDATGVPVSGPTQPRIYYRKGSGTWFSQQGVLASGTSQSGTWTFTIVVADMGGIAANDQVNYYIVAQDLTAGPLITSNPVGVSASDVNTIITPPPANLFNVTLTLNGNYNVGAGGAFTTLTAAVTAYNNPLNCQTGPVTFLLTDVTYTTPSETVLPISISARADANSVNTLTIKPALGVITTITGSTTTSILKLNGADYVIIDGSNSATVNSYCPTVSASRNLTISNTGTGSNSTAVWIASLGAGAGATNNVLRNCNLSCGADVFTSASLTYGVIATGSTISSSSTVAFDNNNNVIENNSITKSRYGIVVRGVANTNNTGNIIRGNIIGPATFGSNNIGKTGILFWNQDNGIISYNEIRNVGLDVTSTNTVGDRFGIALGNDVWPVSSPQSVTGTRIEKNNIHDIVDERAASSIGLYIGTVLTATNNIIANNTISKVRGNPVTADKVSGLAIAGGSGDKVVFNSVTLAGDMDPVGTASLTQSVSGIKIDSIATPFVNNLTLANNLVYVDVNSNTSTIKHYAIIAPATSYSWGAGFSNNNDFSVNATNTQMVLGALGLSNSSPLVNVASITAWRTQFSPNQDAASQSVSPAFVSATDLHLVFNNFANSTLDNGGVAITGVTDDIDCQARAVDIGADEFTYVPCVTAVLSGNQNICTGASAILTVTLTGNQPWSVTYTDGTNNFVLNGIAASPFNFPVSPSVNTTYNLVSASDVSCSAQPINLSGSATVNVNANPTVSISGSNTYCPSTPSLLTANASAGSGTISTYAWTLNGNPVGSNLDTYSANAAGNYVVTVTNSNGCTATSSGFSLAINTYSISASATGGGSITPSGSTSVNCESNQSYIISSDACHVLDSVYVDGVNLGAITNYTFSSVTSNHTIDAYFHALTYTINASASAGGSILPGGVSTINCGDNQTYTITTANCYQLDSVVVDGVSQGAVGTYTFSNVTSNHSINAYFHLLTYTINASASAGGTINPNGMSIVNCGDNQSYTITAASCYQLDSVYVDGVNLGAISNYTFSNVTANHTINAYFHLLTYAINASASAGGTISPNGMSTVNCGDNQSYTIAANSCYQLDSVLVDGVNQGAISNYTFSNVTSNHAIDAYFHLLTYTINANASAGGTINPNGISTVNCGDNQSYTISTASACYQLDSVVVDGVNQGAVGTYTFNNVTSNHVINAYFHLLTYTINASASAGGAINPNGMSTVNCGDNQSYTIAAASSCYVLDSVVVDGLNQGAIMNYTFSNVTANHSIDAYFHLLTYTINSSATAGGTISPNGMTTVNCGDNQSYTIATSNCYQFDSVLVDGVNMGAITNYTFSNVSSGHTIDAYFHLLTYTINANASAGGTISPSGMTTLNCGDSQSYSISAASACYQLDSVVVDGVNQGAIGTYSFNNVTGNHTINAYFHLLSYTINASASAGGTINPNGVSTVNCGDNLSYTISTAGACYQLDSVVVDGVNQGAISNYAFSNVTANHTINAYFHLLTYTINASASAGGTISPNGMSTVNCGDNQAYLISAANCYQIDSVLVDGINQGAISNYTFSNVTSGHSINAYFSFVNYTILATTGPNGNISPSGSITVACGGSQNFLISANVGYLISDVLVDGNSVGNVSSYNFSNLVSNHTIHALFSIIPSATLNAKMFIEGYVDPATGMMDNGGTGGCLSASFVPGAIATDADTIRISIVNPITLNIVSTQVGILHTNGTVSVTFPNTSGLFYLRITHRNALQTWSASPVLLNPGANSYDFSTAANKAYGSNMTEVRPGQWAFYSGDISDGSGPGLGYQDEIIEAQDYLDEENAVNIILLGYKYEDITGDGVVEAADYLIMENNVGAIRFSIHP